MGVLQLMVYSCDVFLRTEKKKHEKALGSSRYMKCYLDVLVDF